MMVQRAGLSCEVLTSMCCKTMHDQRNTIKVVCVMLAAVGCVREHVALRNVPKGTEIIVAGGWRIGCGW